MRFMVLVKATKDSEAGKMPSEELLSAMAEERPLLEGPVPILVVLALGTGGLIDQDLAIRLSLWLGVAELFAWGMLYARRQRWNWLTSVIAGAVNGLFGLLIVFLEVVVH